MSGNWNEYNLNPLTRIYWRASLVPAAAVIPAPKAYIKVVAVKKLVVGFLVVRTWPAPLGCALERVYHLVSEHSCSSLGVYANWLIYFEKIRVFKAGDCIEYISME